MEEIDKNLKNKLKMDDDLEIIDYSDSRIVIGYKSLKNMYRITLWKKYYEIDVAKLVIKKDCENDFIYADYEIEVKFSDSEDTYKKCFVDIIEEYKNNK